MYVPQESQEAIAREIADKFKRKDLVFFAKSCADLYESYGEFTGDEIMNIVREFITADLKN
ncbi:hypothetical protein [Bacillus wiedmannii]|uniref:hypothetical protein n=1 Tax=Bacillus wiedmannii TaxID=1890302 RepID=UPI001247FD1E|nr:hypothetical protein [Bacillus wiedmannii]